MTVFLLFGANLGDRADAIRHGLDGLERGGVSWTARSAFYETEPVGIEDQPWFLNLAARGETRLAPRDLLRLCKEVEAAAGRRAGPRNGPRPLDVDILLYGNLVLDESELTIPHPRLRERRFALIPLLDIAPDLVDVRDGARYRDVLDRLGEGKKVSKSTTRGF